MDAQELKAYVQGMCGNVTVNGVFGGTEMMEQKVLWEGVLNTVGASAQLSRPVSDFDIIIVESSANTNTGVYQSSKLILPNEIKIREKSQFIDGHGIYISPYEYNAMASYHFDSINSLTMNEVFNEVWAFSITKVIGLKFTSRISYSTEEQCIGTWINGKPLYQRVVPMTITEASTSRGYMFGEVVANNIEYGTIAHVFSSGNVARSTNGFTSRGSTAQTAFYIDASTGKIVAYNTRNDFIGTTWYCVCQYTKN